MERAIPFLLAAAMAGLAVDPAGANDRVLELDGRFYVQGASMHTARVILTLGDGQLRVLANDVRQLSLQLELQEVYLLTFEREGCRAKTILFDTRMEEDDAMNAPFAFHFDVTLEVSTEEEVRYAGPVGYVKYAPGEKDFGYDLDYRLTHDEKGAPLTATAYAADMASVSGKRARSERRRVQPFIDPTLAMLQEAERRSADAATVSAAPVRARLEGVTALGNAVVPAYAAQNQVRSVVVEQEREITIVRVQEGATLADYRRIRHNDGTTWHFRNGSSCSYSEFVAAVGAP